MEENTKKFVIAAVIVIAVSLVSFNMGFTGSAVKEPTALEVTREGSKITVELKYDYKDYSIPNHIVNMNVGNMRRTAKTTCDWGVGEGGYVSRGTGACMREIATFDVSGNWYEPTTRVFTVKDTAIEKRIFI